MIDAPSAYLLLPFLLYAETHYRFRYFFSYLKKAEPEIIADAPHWIEPHQPVPLLLLTKDSHRYPCTLHNVIVQVHRGSKLLFRQKLLSKPVKLTEPYWWRVFALNVDTESGWLDIDVQFDVEIHGKRKIYNNDNYRTSSHLPLRVYKAHEPLPRVDNLVWGDCHTHSTYTEDQVEFGSPLEASLQLCKSMGLSFFGVTDHSYDLDDRTDNYLLNDPTLPKWGALQQTVAALNKKETTFAILSGEEISCRNRLGHNVHMILFGNKGFFPGSGDSAERWLQTRSEMSIEEILLTKEAEALAIAAHPCEDVPLIQRLLLGRGSWASEDLQNENLAGIQFANGGQDRGFQKGYRQWVQSLLLGKRLFALGGNDAHGNFNRFRQIGIPFLKISENNKQLFGKVMTGVFLDGPVTEANVQGSLRAGHSIVSDGPALNLRIIAGSEMTALGRVIKGQHFQIELQAQSSIDFGKIERIAVHKGTIEEPGSEIVLHLRKNIGQSTWKETLTVDVDRPIYLRAEAYTTGHEAYDQQPHFVLTNPVWFRPA